MQGYLSEEAVVVQTGEGSEVAAGNRGRVEGQNHAVRAGLNGGRCTGLATTKDLQVFFAAFSR